MTAIITPETPNGSMRVNASTYLAIESPKRIQEHLSINVTDHCFQPRFDDLESDWVAQIAVPAFKVYRQQQGGAPVNSFCSIGTGSGLDVLSAVEILGASRVGLTDVHEDVVAAAADNIARNVIQNAHKPFTIESGHGDLLAPLRPYGSRYDVIYENLPNILLESAEEVATEQNSSAYLPPRRENLPDWLSNRCLTSTTLRWCREETFCFLAVR